LGHDHPGSLGPLDRWVTGSSLDHYVPFGYLILDAYLYIGDGVTIHASELFDASRAAYMLETCRIMAYKVRGEKLVCYFQVPWPPKTSSSTRRAMALFSSDIERLLLSPSTPGELLLLRQWHYDDGRT
jgi:hypothetical protein